MQEQKLAWLCFEKQETQHRKIGLAKPCVPIDGGQVWPKADILGFEFEMGLFPNIQEEAKSKGIDLAMKYIGWVTRRNLPNSGG